MPFPIPLSFIPPTDPDIVTLHIWESSLPDLGFTEIDQTPAGIYPDYINRYVTEKANSPTDWFAIQWEDSSGARSTLSASIKGGTTTLVGDITERVLLRDDSFDEIEVVQESEAIVSWIYGVNDPYSIDSSTVSKLWLTELSILVMVACLYLRTAQSGLSASYSAGMISESSSSATNNFDALDRLEKRALKRLGIGGSRVADYISDRRQAFDISGGKISIDSSRLLSTRAIITERVIVQDIPSGFYISAD